MKKYLYVLVIILLNLSCFSQSNRGVNPVSFSFYSTLNNSRGVEVRPEHDDWYMSFQAEQFVINNHYHFNWGASLGLMRTYGFVDVFGGIRVGFMNFENSSTPAYGIETEVDYLISDDVFIGVRGAYDVFMNSPSPRDIQSEDLVRFFVKIGYKF